MYYVATYQAPSGFIYRNIIFDVPNDCHIANVPYWPEFCLRRVHHVKKVISIRIAE